MLCGGDVHACTGGGEQGIAPGVYFCGWLPDGLQVGVRPQETSSS